MAEAAADARGKPRAAVCVALQPAEAAAAARERRAALADLWTDEGQERSKKDLYTSS